MPPSGCGKDRASTRESGKNLDYPTNPRAFLREAERDAASDAFGGACDERHWAILRTVHLMPIL